MSTKMLTPHFSEDELCCKCPRRECNMDQAFLALLEELRIRYGKQLTINSGYRCPEYNDTLKNSVAGSKHCLGMAVDIGCIDSKERYELLALAIDIGFGGIGIAKDFIHVDSRTDEKVMWVY